jgi:hypothetical protein
MGSRSGRRPSTGGYVIPLLWASLVGYLILSHVSAA